MILVDSNILIDIFEEDENWLGWSLGALNDAVLSDRVIINSIIVAEVAPKTGSLEVFLDAIQMLKIEIAPLSEEAAYLGGCAFMEHRQNGGTAKSILADFLIGGHAQTLGATILTRDPRFYRAYFPTVSLITPSKDDQ